MIPVLLLGLAIPLTLVLANCQFQTESPKEGIAVEGTVVDAQTGEAIGGAVIEAGSPAVNTVNTDDAGRFHLDDLKLGAKLVAHAQRYHPLEATVTKTRPLRIALSPTQLSGSVTVRHSGEPIANALVAAGDRTSTTDPRGRYSLDRFDEHSTIQITADGFATQTLTYEGQPTLDVELRPTSLKGVVTDADTGKPIARAEVSTGSTEAVTAADGTFLLKDLPDKVTLQIKAAGYEKVSLQPADALEQHIALKPFVVKAAYLTYYGVGDAGLRENVFRLLRTTELNAVVIDIKGDYGKLAYKTSVPLAEKIGAQNGALPIPDIDAFIAYCKANGIYTIARIVTFKDDQLGRNGSKAGIDVAAKDRRTGGPVIDREGLVWVDPFRREVWDYNIAIAKDAALKGFDEVQFDYLRFPTDFREGGSYRDVLYSQPNTSENRVKAISGFLAAARAALDPLGTFLSVDVFGYTAWQDDDDNMPIGQNIVELAKYVDFVSPMVYPSTFSYGLPMSPSYLPAPQHPYEIVYYSLKRAVGRLADARAKVRPWLQYFDDYTLDPGKPYNAAEIEAQKKATRDAGAVGFLFWDPTNRYAKGGLAPQ